MDVGRENQQNLNSIGETELKFLALDSGKSEFAKAQLDNSRAEKELSLKKGAQVMLIKVLNRALIPPILNRTVCTGMQ